MLLRNVTLNCYYDHYGGRSVGIPFADQQKSFEGEYHPVNVIFLLFLSSVILIQFFQSSLNHYDAIIRHDQNLFYRSINRCCKNFSFSSLLSFIILSYSLFYPNDYSTFYPLYCFIRKINYFNIYRFISNT